MSGTITKHVVVIGELSVQVGKKQLLEVSELEQEIACRADHSAQLQRVKKLVADENIAIHDALRLILLYSLRYVSFSSNKLGWSYIICDFYRSAMQIAILLAY